MLSETQGMKTQAKLRRENEELRIQLDEALETLRAIREGDVDAVIISGSNGEQVFSLAGADSVYRLIVETMKEAAFTMALDGTVLFCNAQFGQLVNRPLQQIVGRSFQELVSEDDRSAASSLLALAQEQPVRQRLVFRTEHGTAVPSHIATNLLDLPDGLSICVVASDLTELENSTDLIQQLSRQKEALREAHARIAAILERMSDGFAAFDHNWRFTHVNQAAADMFRKTPEQLLGKSLWEAWPEANDHPLGAAVRRSVEDNISLKFESFFPELNRWFECRCFPAGNRLATFFTDTTDRKLAEEELHAANEELEKRVAKRTTQLSETVDTLQEEVAQREAAEEVLRERSEQLRNLASELTLAEQRERRRVAEVLHDNLQQLLAGAKMRLSRLGHSEDAAVKRVAKNVLDLLDESIECSRSLTAELSPPVLYYGSLAATMQWLAAWMQQKHDLRIELDLDESANPLSEEIKILLFQSAQEALFNAVKHAEVDQAHVRLEKTGGFIRLTVSDNGVGFDPQMVEPLMGRSGGFGLFSIRERLGLMGGRLEVDSTPGQGSRIQMLAPLETSAGIAAPLARPDARTSTFVAPKLAVTDATDPLNQNIRILLVDDHVVVRQGLSLLLLEEPDMEIVAEASDGATAIELVRRLRPDVVMMDVSMPGMDGIEATKIIHAEFPRVCVIGLSMFKEDERGPKMREAGAAYYLTKSGPSEVLISTIRNCVAAG